MTIKELQDKIYESRELNDKFETAHDIGMEHNVIALGGRKRVRYKGLSRKGYGVSEGGTRGCSKWT